MCQIYVNVQLGIFLLVKAVLLVQVLYADKQEAHGRQIRADVISLIPQHAVQVGFWMQIGALRLADIATAPAAHVQPEGTLVTMSPMNHVHTETG